MAATLPEEERNRRIKLIGEYFEKTGAPTRKIAEYFSNNEFKISNKTVHDYIQRYKKMTNSNKIDGLIKNNRGQLISDEGVIERVFKVSRLVLEGHTMKEISEILEISTKTVERDLFLRLKQICSYDEDLQIYCFAVLNCLTANKLNALEENRLCKKKYIS